MKSHPSNLRSRGIESVPQTVPCPTCRKAAIFGSRNPYRPFCSERCKLIDLGEWASEKYRIAGSRGGEGTGSQRGDKTDFLEGGELG